MGCTSKTQWKSESLWKCSERHCIHIIYNQRPTGESKGWERLKNQGASFCAFFHMNQLLFWGDKPELLLLLLLSSYLGQIGGVWVLFLGLVVSVQCRYWPDLRLTALQCFPMVHPLSPWGDIGSPTAHQVLANAWMSIYSCVLLVVIFMVVEDSDLLFDPAYNHPNKETFAIIFFF